MYELAILDSTGDTKITWEPDDPESCAKARETVEDLKKLGYSFFLTDGPLADEVAQGKGELIVRKLTAEEVVSLPGATTEPEPEPEPAPDGKKKRGRPPKGGKVVAVRPMAGG